MDMFTLSAQPFKIAHDTDYHDIVNNKESLKRCTENLLNHLIDELTLGIIFDIHRKYKTRAFEIHDESPLQDEDDEQNIESFSPPHVSNQECICPNCNRGVLAIKFAPHLEVCMGMGRSRLRTASRRIASNKNNNNKERDNNTSYTEMPSDDEDYGGWASSDKRKKKKHRNNGTKKGKGTPKKNNNENDSFESGTIDVEGEEDLESISSNNSNSSSPVDSPSSFKKQEKNKNKKK